MKSDSLRLLGSVSKLQYAIIENSTYASSGGGQYTNIQRNLSVDELNGVLDELSNATPVALFNTSNGRCFFTSGPSPVYFVCSADNLIVYFIRAHGPGVDRWHTADFEFNILRSSVINQITDLQSCNYDSDCELTYTDICINQTAFGATAQYDPGCRASINGRYYFGWTEADYVNDQCISATCGNTGFKPVCQNNKCIAISD